MFTDINNRYASLILLLFSRFLCSKMTQSFVNVFLYLNETPQYVILLCLTNVQKEVIYQILACMLVYVRFRSTGLNLNRDF